MQKAMRTTVKALVLSGIAIGVGAGIAFAVSDTVPTGGGNAAVIAGDSEPGNLTVAGTVRVSGGSMGLSGGTDTTDDLIMYRDLYGSGNDLMVFGTSSQDANASIFFELGGSYPDAISYIAGTDEDDDSLNVQSDEVTITANTGDVIIQLGSAS